MAVASLVTWSVSGATCAGASDPGKALPPPAAVPAVPLPRPEGALPCFRAGERLPARPGRAGT
jgi:hypothetical protein